MNKSSFATYNVLHKILNTSKRIIYEPSYSLFDKVFTETDLEAYYYNDNSLTDQFYDAYISNDFLRHSMSRAAIEAYHIYDILFIHEIINSQFKKEDKAILNNNLKNTTKIVFHDSLLTSWQFLNDKIYSIKYGIPNITIDFNKNRKDILVLNLKKNDQYNLMYQHLKNTFPNTTMLTEIKDYTWQNIYDLISDYKVVIDESSIYNQLIAAYCGCLIITPHIHFDKQIIGYFNVENFNSIFNIMQSILASYDTESFSEQISHIKTEYPLDVFSSNIINTIQKVKQDPFII